MYCYGLTPILPRFSLTPILPRFSGISARTTMCVVPETEILRAGYQAAFLPVHMMLALDPRFCYKATLNKQPKERENR